MKTLDTKISYEDIRYKMKTRVKQVLKIKEAFILYYKISRIILFRFVFILHFMKLSVGNSYISMQTMLQPNTCISQQDILF